MTDTCLNPECFRETDTIGVCVSCANGDYDPRTDGVSLEWEPYTTGGVTSQIHNALREELQETQHTLERLKLLGGGSE